MTYRIKSYNNIDKNKWSEFVTQNPEGNFFQIPELYEVYEKTRNYTPIFLAITNNQDDILALLLAVRIQEFGGPFGLFSSRSVIQGGPLFQDTELGREAFSLLMKEYDKIAKRCALYTEIRNISDRSIFNETFRELGYDFKNHLNILVNLKKPKDDLLGGLSKSRRRFLRKAKENGVKVEEIKNRQQIPAFYELLKETYKNAKHPIADISLFDNAFTILYHKNLIKFFLAEHNDEYIGGIMTPIYKGVITEWYITGSREHSKLYPSDAITWHPIEWGAANGFSIFDFGGAGEPEKKYGVRDFKMQFGGELVNFGRFMKIHSPKKMWIAKNGYEYWKKIRM
jgi:serine/alanine adding enzyme